MQHSVSCLDKFTPVSQCLRYEEILSEDPVPCSIPTKLLYDHLDASGHNQHHQLFCDFWNCDIRVQHYILQHNLALLLYWGYTGCQWVCFNIITLLYHPSLLSLFPPPLSLWSSSDSRPLSPGRSKCKSHGFHFCSYNGTKVCESCITMLDIQLVSQPSSNFTKPGWQEYYCTCKCDSVWYCSVWMNMSWQEGSVFVTVNVWMCEWVNQYKCLINVAHCLSSYCIGITIVCCYWGRLWEGTQTDFN